MNFSDLQPVFFKPLVMFRSVLRTSATRSLRVGQRFVSHPARANNQPLKYKLYTVTAVSLLTVAFGMNPPISNDVDEQKVAAAVAEAQAVEEQKEVEEPKVVENKTEEDGETAESSAPVEGEGHQAAAFNPETGEINWDCPCLGGMAHGPCGEEFKEAFSCFVFSETEPKGIDCIKKFEAMRTCFKQHPEHYKEELYEDETQEELVDTSGEPKGEVAAKSKDEVVYQPENAVAGPVVAKSEST